MGPVAVLATRLGLRVRQVPGNRRDRSLEPLKLDLAMDGHGPDGPSGPCHGPRIDLPMDLPCDL